MNKIPGVRTALRNEKLCLRCRHLYVKTDDPQKRICGCENPYLVSASEIHFDGVAGLRQKHKFNPEKV